MKKNNRPEKIGGIIEDVLSERGYLSQCHESQVKLRWSKIVGDELAEASECRGVENGILYVRVPSAAWRQEMSYQKEHIMAQIRIHTKCRSIKEIVFI